MATLKEQLESARTELEKLEASVTPEETEEQRDIAALAEITSKRDAIIRERRDRDLAKRLMVSRAAHPGVVMLSLTLLGFDDGFIVKRNAAAHKVWMASQEKRSKDPTIDRYPALISYAMAVVVDWNGKPVDSVNIRDLEKYLEKNEAVADGITNAAIEMSGLIAEGKKR